MSAIVVLLKSQVVLLQTAHSWANAGVLLGARMHREAPLRFTYESLTGTFLATPHAERAVIIGWQ